MSIRNCLLIFLSLFLISACGEQEKQAISFGKFENGEYTNDFFNLKVPIPDSWFVMDDDARIEHMQRSAKMMAGNNENLKAVFEAADLPNLSLLTASEVPPGSPVTSNPSIMILAEKVKHLPGIKRGSDYHYHTKKVSKGGAVKVTFPKEIYESNIDNKSFDVMEINIDMEFIQQYQKQYATIDKDYALLIILTYQDEDGLKKLNQILESIKIN